MPVTIDAVQRRQHLDVVVTLPIIGSEWQASDGATATFLLD